MLIFLLELAAWFLPTLSPPHSWVSWVNWLARVFWIYHLSTEKCSMASGLHQCGSLSCHHSSVYNQLVTPMSPENLHYFNLDLLLSNFLAFTFLAREIQFTHGDILNGVPPLGSGAWFYRLIVCSLVPCCLSCLLHLLPHFQEFTGSTPRDKWPGLIQAPWRLPPRRMSIADKSPTPWFCFG